MKKELTPLILFLSAFILFGLLSGVGIIATYILGLLYFWKSRNFLKMFTLPFMLIYQLWNACKYVLYSLAVGLDLLGNVAVGELIELLVTDKRNTLLGKGNITISASLGKLQLEKELNKRGLKFSKLLDKIFEQNHCILAYLKYTENENKTK
ncbi:MAG: hypothetical protein DRI95_00650 [Bacteroidetes bacterium]|nr:MAG: hypothetical protein DRI95_00650 [Bacteroidota bacterium]